MGLSFCKIFLVNAKTRIPFNEYSWLALIIALISSLVISLIPPSSKTYFILGKSASIAPLVKHTRSPFMR